MAYEHSTLNILKLYEQTNNSPCLHCMQPEKSKSKHTLTKHGLNSVSPPTLDAFMH